MLSENEAELRNTLALRDYIRPLRGGLQIEGRNPFTGAIGVCTYGLNVRLNGVDMWLTNSHCTSQFSSTSTTYFGQSIWVSLSSSTYVGSEFRDYSGQNNMRFSDAALVEKSGQTAKFGYILITDGIGSVTLVPDQSDYKDVQIINEWTPLRYYEIQRIGRTQGWTNGILTNPCTNVSNIEPPMDGWTLQCQIRSTVPAGSGDSGSPVFLGLGGGIFESGRLIGIHWGGGSGVSYHSRIDAIRDELTLPGETLLTH